MIHGWKRHSWMLTRVSMVMRFRPAVRSAIIVPITKQENQNKNMLEDKDPEEIKEIAEIAENQGVDVEDAEKIKELMDDEGLDEDEAAELSDLL